jgi:hypothetical protein
MTHRALLATIACLTLSTVARPATQSAAGDGIVVTPVVADGTVAVSLAAAPAVGSDTRALVESGLLVTLRFVVDLKRPSIWWDRTVRSQTVSSAIKLDTLTGMYHVSRLQDGHVTWSDRTRTFAEARDWSATFERIPLATQADLDSNGEYYIEVRMTTSPRRTFSLWPFFGADARTGRADFTFIR